MDSPTGRCDRIKAILFDMNGTLRMRIPDEKWQHQAIERLLAILGMPEAPVSYLEELSRRYETYIRWADESETSLPESEIWTRWITPDVPPGRIQAHAADLMLAFRNRKGRSILKPGAYDVLNTLSQRGYRMGVISNTTSSIDLPRFIEECGLKKLFEVVTLSSKFGIRKPGPGIFREAARLLDLDPEQCAYIGNKIASDIVGAHMAGFGMAMIIMPRNELPTTETDQIEKPDLSICELVDLLDIFPPRLQY